MQDKIVSTLVGLIFATFAGADANAQEIQTRRVTAQQLDLSATDAGNIHLKIWSDKIGAITGERQRLIESVPKLELKLATEVFTATFGDGIQSFVLSAINYHCGASSATPNVLSCPARIFAVKNKEIRLLRELDSFPFSSLRSDTGFDEISNTQTSDKTMVSFDPKSRQIRIQIYSGGRLQPGAQSISIN